MDFITEEITPAETTSNEVNIEDVKEESTKENSFFDDIPDMQFNIDEEVEKLASTPKENEGNPFEEESDAFADDFGEGKESEDFTDSFEQQPQNKNAKKNAKMFARWMDTLISFFLSFYSKDEDFTKFKAEKTSLKVIEESLESGLNTMKTSIEMPWYMTLFIEIPVTYWHKFQMARRLRKVNLKKNKPVKPSPKSNIYEHHKQREAAAKQSKTVEDVVFTEVKDGKNTCPVCAKEHTNKVYCSKSCRMKGLNS